MEVNNDLPSEQSLSEPDRDAIQVRQVTREDAAFEGLLDAAEQLEQKRYLLKPRIYAQEDHCFGAFCKGRCVGFLRFVLFDIGRDTGCSQISVNGSPLREGYVEAFGVLPAFRRVGTGQRLQEATLAYCRAVGAYQVRSRSPITAVENYALKIKMGYAIHPSHENDSYYFVKVLTPNTPA